VTKARARPPAEPLEIVREMIRRAGHEIRNALNGVAVNVEVVRSRVTREGAPTDVASFAERASSQVGEAGALTDGLLALVSSVLAAEAAGTLKRARGRGAGTRIELMIYGDNAAGVVSDIERLTSRIGVGIEQRERRVILTILPEGKSHSKD
jgi:signal transduction histidine kinase